MILTIDGPAGSGKSTLARKLAEILGWLHINSGLFYRKAGSMHHEPVLTEESKKLLLHKFQKYLDENIEKLPQTLDKEEELKTSLSGNKASLVSAIPELREQINSFLRKKSEGKNIVAEGRDMSTEAFPEAEIQVYLDAKPEERAQRRWKEEGGDPDKILKEILERDDKDKNKAVGALRVSPNAWIIENTYLTIDQLCEKVLVKLNKMTGQGE